MALNQQLIQMDGVDEPPATRKFLTNRINTILDALYIVPRKIGGATLRLRPPRPRPEQIYFIGATNVPIEQLDPALVRPGRMGRHIWFRTPTKDDRKDIFDLYLAKVDHDPDLDSEKRRDELARITNGYSPAMIEQCCSMALTLAHSDAREVFTWADIVEADDDDRVGTAQGVDYVPDETRAVAIHEAGHAVASHVYMNDVLSTRLSIRKRGARWATTRRSRRRRALLELAPRGGRQARVDARGHGRRARLLRRELDRRRRRRPERHVALRPGWSACAAWAPSPIDLNGTQFASEEERREAEDAIMKRFERIGIPDYEPRRRPAGVGRPDPGDPGRPRPSAPPPLGSSARRT